MKRLITLSLAALMVMGLCTTAFAAYWIGNVTEIDRDVTPVSADGVNGIYGTAFFTLRDVDSNEDDLLVPMSSGELSPGMTIYYPLIAKGSTGTPPSKLVTAADAVKSLKVTAKALTGGEFIESYRIEYKKFFEAGVTGATYEGTYAYVLAIKTKERADTGRKNYGAEIKLSKTSGAEKNTPANTYTTNFTVSLGFTINFSRNKVELYRYPVVLDYNYSEVSPDTEITIDFKEGGDVYFEVDMFQQGRIIAAFNVRFNSEISALYPAANLDFYNGNGATFAKIGTLTIPAESGSFLYMQDADGNLVAVDADYDDAEEAFKVSTRVLGKYVVSDIELDLVAAAPEGEPTPEEPVLEPEAPVKENVATGAVA